MGNTDVLAGETGNRSAVWGMAGITDQIKGCSFQWLQTVGMARLSLVQMTHMMSILFSAFKNIICLKSCNCYCKNAFLHKPKQ